MIQSAVLILLTTSGFLFARRSLSPAEFLGRFLIFAVFVIFTQSIFTSINLILKISSFEILVFELSLMGLAILFWLRRTSPRTFALSGLIGRDLASECLAAIALILYGTFCLTKVHSGYVGFASSFLQPEFFTSGLNYPYPYFSDEWHAVSLSQKSLTTGIMPFYYPYSTTPLGFINVQWLFHNFNSGIFQFFFIEPLTSYVNLGIVINIGIVALSFSILRALGVTRISSFLAASLIFHITHASNFPSVWAYLPIHLGIISLLAGMLSLIYQWRLLYLFFWTLTYLVYPPLILFILPLVWLARGKISLKIPTLCLASGVLVFLVALFFNSSMTTASPDIWHYLFSRVIFLKPTPEIHDSLNPFFIISPVAICLAMLGLTQVRKRAPLLLLSLIMTSLFWITYSLTPWRFVIDYPRVAFICALCVSLLSGFGLDQLIKNQSRFRTLFSIVFLIYLGWYGFNYTQFNDWGSLQVQLTDGSERIIKARPPANLILTPDDLRIAGKIKNEFFVSDPWKSTALAAAAQVRPLFLKSGTISDLSPIKYDEFKLDICKHLKPYWRLRFYVYFHESTPVNCEGLVFQDSSAENFKLYFHAGVTH